MRGSNRHFRALRTVLETVLILCYDVVYSRYEAKINNNKITENELTELEDEIIYFQYV